MSEKIAVAKPANLSALKKALPVRKAPAKKSPAVKAATPVKRVPAKAVTAKTTTTKPAPVAAAKTVKKVKKAKKTDTKIKVVRDSFTMPKSDYAKIDELKQLCQKAGVHVKKSELLRAGLHALNKLTAVQLTQAVASLEKIKTGRPKSN